MQIHEITLTEAGLLQGIKKAATGAIGALTQRRGDVTDAGIDAKADRADLELLATRRDVTLLVRTAINDLSQFEAQLALQRDAVRLFRILSAGEQAKFDAGESTLFLVNTRERAVLDEEIKLVALQAKYLAARAALAVAAGAPGRLPELR